MVSSSSISTGKPSKTPAFPFGGGNPILFPICGSLQDGQYEWDGNVYKMAQHGLARNMPWEVIRTSEDGEALITLRLSSTKETLEAYPFTFELEFTYALKDGKLRIEQSYRNFSDKDMPFYTGFHPYFIADRKTLDYETDASRMERISPEGKEESLISGPISLEDTSDSIALLDARKPRIAFEARNGWRIRMAYDEVFRYMVLWSLPDRPFICVEPWMALPDELNRRQELVRVAPGDVFKAALSISAEKV